MTDYLRAFEAEIETPKNEEEVRQLFADIRSAALAGFKGVSDEQSQLRADLDKLGKGIQALSAKAAARDAAGDVGDASDQRTYLEKNSAVVSSAPSGCFVEVEGGHVQVRSYDTEDGVRLGLLDDAPTTDWQRDLQRKIARWNTVATMISISRGRSVVDRSLAPKCRSEVFSHLQRAPRNMRIFSSAVAESGAEWIPKSYLPTLIKELEVRSVATGIFPRIPWTGQGNTIEWPYQKGHLRPFTHSIPTGNDPANDPLSGFATDSLSIQSVPHVVGTQLHRDSSEDALIAVEPIVRERLITAFLNGRADTIWNGDKAGVQDDLENWNTRGLWGTGDFANDHRKEWDGIRKRALARNAVDFTALAGADQNTTREILALAQLVNVAISTNPNELAVVVNTEGLFRLLKYSDLDNNTTGIFAPNISGAIGSAGGGALPGQVGLLWGRYPVVLDDMLTADLNAAGVYDNVTTTKTCMLTVARSRYALFNKKGAVIESETDIRNNTRTLVARHRDVFAELVPASEAELNCAILYNIPNA